jgi:DNA-binding CsgD family transcriptional regulator
MLLRDTRAIVDEMAEPAFVVGARHRFTVWNKGAERLLGYDERSVLGKRCDRVLCGTDVFENRFCDANCPVLNMARHRETVRGFQLNLRAADAQAIRTHVTVIVLSKTTSRFAILHVLKLLQPAQRGLNIPGEPANSNFSALPLTRREIEVIRYLAEGVRVRQIAQGLFISTVTVRNHIQAILRKLNVHSRLEAVSLARQAGLV